MIGGFSILLVSLAQSAAWPEQIPANLGVSASFKCKVMDEDREFVPVNGKVTAFEAGIGDQRDRVIVELKAPKGLKLSGSYFGFADSRTLKAVNWVDGASKRVSNVERKNALRIWIDPDRAKAVLSIMAGDLSNDDLEGKNFTGLCDAQIEKWMTRF